MKSCPECAATYPDDYAVCPKDGAPLHETSLWQIGTVVRGKYRIKARLGEGGMAIVYKAHHELLDEERALKVIKPELARDPEFMGRFKNEAIMARKLNHPNAVRVDDLDIAEDGLPFIAMELVVGDTLKTLIQRTGPLPVSLVLDVSADVCDALDAAHKLGLVHRDIKPENIVLVAQREGPPIAKILDFGISRLRQESTGAKGLTQTGMVIGTPEYMSPEQAIGKRGDEIDGRSDLYSLGVVMYRMLTGELPFVVETTVEMILQHLKTPPKPPHQLKPELAIPEAVSLIVMKALEKDPNKRYATGKEMAAAIKQARGSTTRPSHKIDWKALSSAAASFGADPEAFQPSKVHSPIAMARALPVNSPVPSTPTPERPIYRTSARIGPPPREFPTPWILAAAGLAVLIVCTFILGKHMGHGNAAKQNASPPHAIVVPEPAKTPEPSPSARNKIKETPKTGPASSASDGQRPAERTDLTYTEQAKIIELNALADSYYRQEGCDKALPLYQKVLEVDSGNPHAYAVVERCYAEKRSGGKTAPIPTVTPDNSPNP